VLTHAIAMGIGIFVVARGVRGIERAASVLIPSLFVLVVLLAIRAVTLPGAERRPRLPLHPELGGPANSRIWLEALTQNAWDTGAGWGLALTLPVGRWWVWVVGVLVPLEALVLLAWWLGQAAQGDLAEVLAPWSTFNVGTVLVQWGIALAVLLAANRWLGNRSLARSVGEAPEPAPIGQSGVAP
jgi:hypothetical protein